MKPSIAGSDLVGAVLERDPALIDVFARHSRHFDKLRNPMLRRTMARLVTVEQAAGIAGVAVDQLVRDLNAAIGVEVAATQPEQAARPVARVEPAREVARPPGLHDVELDLRDDLRNGREPFSRIMSAVSTLRDDQALHLRAIFEPVPLYTVLGKRGFSHEARSHAADDWSVWFWRDGGDAATSAAEAAPDAVTPAQEWPGEHCLDVRGLEPPEPMVRTLAALESLPLDATLVQINVRVPQFLLPILAERGFAAEIDDTQPDRVLVRIRRSSQPLEKSVSNQTSQPIELDVRIIAPREKHPTIFRTFDGLRSGESMIIINDHDPRPLRYQFAAERPEAFEWTYLAEGPETWRVQIDRR